MIVNYGGPIKWRLKQGSYVEESCLETTLYKVL